MKHQLLAILLLIVTLNLDAEDIKIEHIGDNMGKSETPIDVDLNDAILSINIKEAATAYVVVVGPEGVVYQQNITPKTFRIVRVGLMQYQDGDYTITYYSQDGKVLEGSFFLYKPQTSNVL